MARVEELSVEDIRKRYAESDEPVSAQILNRLQRDKRQGVPDAPRAPRTLIETTRIFHASRIARDWFGDSFVAYFAATREQEWRVWLDAVTDWELRRYAEII